MLQLQYEALIFMKTGLNKHTRISLIVYTVASSTEQNKINARFSASCNIKCVLHL